MFDEIILDHMTGFIFRDYFMSDQTKRHLT